MEKIIPPLKPTIYLNILHRKIASAGPKDLFVFVDHDDGNLSET
jgi:hypothetical protein